MMTFLSKGKAASLLIAHKILALKNMRLMKRAVIVLLLALVMVWPNHRIAAQDLRREIEGVVRDYIQRNPQDIQRIIKEYLVGNPEVLQQLLAESLKRQRGGSPAIGAPDLPDKASIIRDNADVIFNSKHQLTAGNAQGDVTLVEFFDYSCGFCKRALSDKLELIKGDPKLRLVLKDFPILGPNSVAAARVAIAVRMQDGSGAKAFEFHRQLLADRMPPTRERALAIARDIGIDVAQIEKDENSSEVQATLDENVRLAQTLGINGTPSYVVGDSIVVGAVGLLSLREKISSARR